MFRIIVPFEAIRTIAILQAWPFPFTTAWAGSTFFGGAIAFKANAVVTPRFPILMPVDPYLYIHPASHPPS